MLFKNGNNNRVYLNRTRESYLNKNIRLNIFPIFLIVVLTIIFSSTAQATHSWGSYHWARTAHPFTLKLGDNLTSKEWKSYLSQASQDWNSDPLGQSPLMTSIVTGSGGKRCSSVSGTTQVCNGTYGNNGWLGLATIYLSGDHITRGTAKMNDTYFNLDKYNNPNEKLHVMCQEVAHTFGLGHQDESGASLNTCMDYFSNTGANALNTDSTKPNAHDFEELNIIYGSHFDSTTTLASSATNPSVPSQANDEITNDPNSWGQLISQSANGRSSTYERHISNGTRVITHVYWTEEAAHRCPACDHRYDH